MATLLGVKMAQIQLPSLVAKHMTPRNSACLTQNRWECGRSSLTPFPTLPAPPVSWPVPCPSGNPIREQNASVPFLQASPQALAFTKDSHGVPLPVLALMRKGGKEKPPHHQPCFPTWPMTECTPSLWEWGVQEQGWFCYIAG